MTDHQDRKLFTVVTTYQRYDSESKQYRIDDSFIVNYNTATELISSLRPETKDYSSQGRNFSIPRVDFCLIWELKHGGIERRHIDS